MHKSIRVRIVRSLKIRLRMLFLGDLMKKNLNYFTKVEWFIWLSSLILITASFLIFGGESFLSFIASLLGTTGLIFCAKGNPVGQIIVILFSFLYGYISFTFEYYGEMLTYLCMSAPMAMYAFVSWIKNPYNGNRSEVKVNRIGVRETVFMFILSALVTVLFYFILKFFGTANLLPSTISVTTSFIAVYLTARRSPLYAVAYAANDIVLIILWGLASLSDVSYVSVVVCFVIFLVNDIYGYVNWLKMEKAQSAN